MFSSPSQYPCIWVGAKRLFLTNEMGAEVMGVTSSLRHTTCLSSATHQLNANGNGALKTGRPHMEETWLIECLCKTEPLPTLAYIRLNNE